MCSIFLRPLAHSAPLLRVSPATAAIAGLLLVALSATASAEPFASQPYDGVSIKRDSDRLPTLTPFYGSGVERPFDEETWRSMRPVGLEDRPEAPTGFIASIGRFGLKVDSSGSGPKVRGLAWSPTDSVSIVAGGDLRGGAGLGASLSLRFGF